MKKQTHNNFLTYLSKSYELMYKPVEYFRKLKNIKGTYSFVMFFICVLLVLHFLTIGMLYFLSIFAPDFIGYQGITLFELSIQEQLQIIINVVKNSIFYYLGVYLVYFLIGLLYLKIKKCVVNISLLFKISVVSSLSLVIAHIIDKLIIIIMVLNTTVGTFFGKYKLISDLLYYGFIFYGVYLFKVGIDVNFKKSK